MPTGLAYLIVVLVWATTPLAIKWSAEAVPPVMAAMSRMMLAVAIGLPWLWLQGKRLPWDRAALLAYGAAVPGVFGAMALSYLASSYVPPGLISVMFGLGDYLYHDRAIPLWRYALEGVTVILIYDFAYYFVHRYPFH